MLAALLLCLRGQDRSDVRLPAAIGEVMATRLSEVFGVTIKTDATLAEIPLIFNVKNVTFDEFRPIAAKGVDATWKEQDGTWILYRTPEQIKAEDDAFLARRSEFIRKRLGERVPTKVQDQSHIEKFASDIRYLDDSDLSDRMYDESGFPDELVGDMVFDALGVDYLANLPIDHRYVYTSDGRERTKKLPALQKVIDTVTSETERFKKALVDSGAWNRLVNSASVDPDYLFWWLDLGQIETLVLEVISTEGGIFVNASGFDKTGTKCVQYYDEIYDVYGQTSALPDSLNDQFADLSPESLAYRKAYEDMYDGESEIEFHDFFVNIYKDIPEREPLALEISDILLAVSDKTGKPLAGRLSDDSVEYGDTELFFPTEDEEGYVEIKRIPIKAGVAWLDQDIQVEVGDDMVKIAPESPVRFQPVYPRRAIGNYVRANIGRRTIDLSRLGTLAEPPATSEESTLGQHAFVVHQFNEGEEADLSIVSTWSQLSGPQRQQAMSARGVDLPLSACSGLLRFDFNASAVNYGQWSMLIGSLESEEATDFEDEERKDVLADWILADLDMKSLDRLQINVRARSFIAVRDVSEEYGSYYSYKAEDLATMYWMVEEEGDEDAMRELQKATYSVDEALLIEIRYDTPIGVMMDYARFSTRLDVAQNRTLNQLPAPFLQQFQAALAKLRNGGGLNRAG